MHLWQTRLAHQLQELHLIRCSLLPGETFAFVLPPEDLAIWTSLLDAFTDAGSFIGGGGDDGDEEDGVIASLADPPCQARFEIRVLSAPVCFEVALPSCSDLGLGEGTTLATTSISVRCARDVSRDEHEWWYAEIRARKAAVDDGCAFPLYELLTLLTTTLHQSQVPDRDLDHDHDPDHGSAPAPAPAHSVPTPTPSPPWHALLTSHHLVSPTKRRALHHWSGELGITGFAKVGYPGVVYAEGSREGVEAFVRNVKGMQWLALRVRFLETLPSPGSGSDQGSGGERWIEVSKIGEVLEQMRMRGREALVTNLGIGVPSKEPKR